MFVFDVITLSSTGSKEKLLEQYEQQFQTAPDAVLKFLKITKADKADDKRDSSEKEEKSRESSKETGEEPVEGETTRRPSRVSVVLSSRDKSLEELPSLAARVARKIPFKPKLPSRTPRSSRRDKSCHKEEGAKEVDVTEYISPSGEILYPKLIKDEVLRCDADLLVAAKKASAIGGEAGFLITSM